MEILQFMENFTHKNPLDLLQSLSAVGRMKKEETGERKEIDLLTPDTGRVWPVRFRTNNPAFEKTKCRQLWNGRIGFKMIVNN